MVALVSTWSTDPSANDNLEGIPMYEGMTPAQLNDSIRAIMAAVRVEHDERVAAEAAVITTVNAALAAQTATVNAAIAALTGFDTGDLLFAMAPTARAGWLLLNGFTIGNAASGGTGRANADTVDLFTHLWNNFDNTQLPIQDSTGAPGARGASAAADYAANMRMPLWDGRDEFFRMASATNILGTKYAEAIKQHHHTLPSCPTSGTGYGYTGTAGVDATPATETGDLVAGGGTETRPRNMTVNVFIKL